MFHKVPNVTFVTRLIKSINNKISKYIFEFNKIIFEGYFPKKEFLKICLRYKLIPYKNLNFFNFDVNENNLSKEYFFTNTNLNTNIKPIISSNVLEQLDFTTVLYDTINNCQTICFHVLGGDRFRNLFGDPPGSILDSKIVVKTI